MSYVVREPEIIRGVWSPEKVGFRKLNILHGTEIVGAHMIVCYESMPMIWGMY